MKTDFQIAKNVFARMLTSGVLNLLLYLILSFLVMMVSTKEYKARIYQVENNKYQLIREEVFDDKASYVPPEGEDIRVEYLRTESPLWVKIVSGTIIQAILFYQLFKALAEVLGQPGYRAKKESKSRFRGFCIGVYAAIPAFCSYIAYVAAIAMKWPFAKMVFGFLNISFRPLVDLVFSFSGHLYSIPNALCMIAVVAAIPLMTQLAFMFGHRFLQTDFRKFMYKKEK
ncbi:MAG: hypothetical protein IJW78_01710 [Clostridia bacterium]|nr:hypothetical protein [Clostridia bacterium]